MSDKPEKRNLPSWMSSKSHPKKHDEDKDPESENKPGTSKNNGEAKGASSSGGRSFSKLLEGVVFVLSGFVNPERSALRLQALEMGAEYKQDWNGDSTLLVCAFPNTPKFRQVQADCGTIVSKEWIAECYSQKKLVDIETYLMHAGKPWRKSNSSHEVDQDEGNTPPDKLHKKGEGKPSATHSKVVAPDHVKKQFSPTEVKKWANDDLTKTIAWLESQDEKPEPSEVKKIAAEGILTCLQDALEALEQNQDIQQVTEQWNFIPHVVEELARLEGVKGSKRSLSRKDILQEAVSCKHIYDRELNSLGDDSTVKKKKQKANEGDKERTADAAYDSDDTIEMTEEEIDLAYKTIATKIFK